MFIKFNILTLSLQIFQIILYKLKIIFILFSFIFYYILYYYILKKLLSIT